MMELTQHLEALLLKNDCVILPELGGFIAHYSPPRWVEDEKLFLPPTRIIGFNPQLTMNDGLLVQSYMEVYSISFAKATCIVENSINELVNELEEKGKIILPNIGTLSMTINHTYKFSPNEDGITTPSLYGLYSFNISKLNKIPSYKVKLQEVVIAPKEEKRRKEIRFNPAFVRHIAAAAVAIIAFFFMSTPVENTYIEQENYANLFSWNLSENISSSLLYHISPRKAIPENEISIIEETPSVVGNAIQTDSDKNETKEITPIEKKEVSKKENTDEVQTKPVTPKTPTYEIIVASIANKTDAPKVIEQYKKQGYPKTSLIEKNGRIRISLMSFTNSQEAYQTLSKLKVEKQFQDAWVLQVK